MLKKLILALGASAPVLLAGNVLAATLPNLTPGSQFRYVFVTSDTRNTSSNNIANYNTFVNNAASTGSQTSGITGPWAAIASTASISARTNTATTGTGGVPIYRVDGTLVANNYGDLWDGSIRANINVDQTGSTRNVFVWTGTSSDGSGFASRQLGGSTNPRIGASSLNSSSWITVGTFGAGSVNHLYAMSPLQEIPTIPEPTTIIASLLVGAGLLPLKRRSQKTK